MIGLSSRSQMSLSSLIIQGHLTSKRQQPHSEPKSWSPAKGRFGRLVIELPATKGTRINVLGFMNRKNDLHPYMFEQSINTSVVVACLHAFCQRIKKKTIVIMDKLSIPMRESFEEYTALWKKK